MSSFPRYPEMFEKGAIWRSRHRAPELRSTERTARSAWYACYTHARAEKRVDALLAQRGIPSFLPVIPLIRQWHDRKRTVDFPLFPSYVFAQFDAIQMASLLRLPGIMNVVRFNGRPAVVSDAEIANIARFARGLAESGFVPPSVEFDPGQKVKITSGPFQGVEAVVTEIRGHRRVIVGLQTIRMGFEVNVPADSLKALNGSSR